MGNPFLLQACLRLDPKDLHLLIYGCRDVSCSTSQSRHEIPKNLEIGKKYHFYKDGHRLYQIKVPMDLRKSNWEALGRCVITEYTIGEDRTEGTFVMVQIFDKNQAEQVTKTYVSDEEVEKLLKNLK